MHTGFASILILRLDITLLALYPSAHSCGPACLGRHPFPHHPRRSVAYMLPMTAIQLRDPVPFFIQLESDHRTLHSVIPTLIP